MATFIELLLPSIHDVLSLREALSKLAQCERHFKTHGVCSIIENFNIIYSCLHHKNELKEETLDEILNTLIKGLVIYESEVKKIINDRMSNDERIKYLNSLKMLTYLVIEFTNFVEKKQIGSKDNDLIPSAVANKKGGKKQTTSKKAATNNLDISLTCNSNFDWNSSKEKILDALSKVLQMNLQKLWDPPIVEEQFVIFVTNLCYKLMENLSSNSLRVHQKKIIKDHLCHILGLTIKKYNHSYGACVMIIQTLPHYDHFSSLYADLIETCVVQLGYESILPDLLREFHHTNLSNGTNTNSGKDNPNLKYYSQFLIDLSDKLAKYLTPYLSLIQDFLEEESYLMRSCVLTCYGEQITKILNQQAITTDLKLREMRNELLDTLIDHIHDENAMTRSRTLQIWSNICKENSIPLSYMTELMKRCVGRMQDTAVSVRKSAFQLLCDLIRRNPYGIESSVETTIETIDANLEKEEDFLKKLCEENDKIAEEMNNNSKRVIENSEGEDEEQKEAINKTITENENEFELQKKKEKYEENILIQKSKLNYLKDMKSFINQIQAAIPILSKLLFSKTQTDVLEVISFFVTCYEHGLVDMLFGIRKMLLLVLYAEKTIKDAVVNAYKTLYLKPAGASTRDSPVIIAKQLIKLLQDLSVGERDALEELVGEFAVSGELGNSVIKVLWEIFATGGGQTNSNETQQAQNKLQALILLSMIIKKIPEKGRANIQVLIEIGLGYNNQSIDQSVPYIANDLEMLKFRETCLTLSYVAPETNVKKLTQQDTSNKGNEENPANESQMVASSVGSKKKDKRRNGGVLNESSNHNNTTRNVQNDDPTQTRLQFNNEPFKLVNSHILFERLSHLIVEQMNNLSTIYWTPFVEHALTCIFKLADNPIIIAEQIVNKLIEKIKPFNYMREKLSKNPPVPLFNEETSTAVTQTQESTQPTEECLTVNSNILSRFFGFLGILATKLLIFLNQSIVCELKRRKLCKENQSTLSLTKKASLSKQSKRRQSIKNIRHFAPQSSITNDMALEEEMGLAQATEAEDVELIFIEKVINLKVAELNPQPGLTSTLAQFLPIIVVILREPFKYPDQELQLACSLALVKLMILSPKICNDHLQLLFTLMEKSTNCDVRAQLILGIGDLVYRYPNALEPYTSHLYLPLRDTKSTQVRMNTIRVLSHLILKEMIKTRGQIYEIALCTIDPDQRISSLAKLFFQELSQRNNGLVIYNAMPDIISQLSGDGSANTNNQGDNNSKTSKARVISEESFHTVVTYLFSFIKRDKQCETLIEKLCHAFRQANTTERKCRDLAFCLTKIQLSENGIKKLKETFKWYADKLCIQNVYEAFKTLIRNARKLPLLKNETKIMLDELEKQIEEIKQKGLSNENNDQEMEQEDQENEEEEQDVTTSKKPSRNEATNNKQKQNVATASKSILSRKPTANNAATSSKSKTNSKSGKNNKTVNNRKRVKKVESSSDDDDNDQKSSNESDSSSDLATTDSD